MAERVLVTGATGYIGGRLVPRLLTEGYEVRAMTRSARRGGAHSLDAHSVGRCHATRPLPRRVLVTAALASAVDRLELPAEPGITPRAVRTVLRRMASLARDDGTMRYGLRGSRLAKLTSYSLATVRRAQRYLVDHGLVERVKVGGGRYSTHWRIVVDRLLPRHNSRTDVTPQPDRPDTAQGLRSWFSQRIDGRRSAPRPPGSTPAPPRWRAGARVEVCSDHGGAGGLLGDGRPLCPQCRRHPRRD